jgi:hypothetical protein
MRSFQGDLRYEPIATGACFVIELLICEQKELVVDV